MDPIFPFFYPTWHTLIHSLKKGFWECKKLLKRQHLCLSDQNTFWSSASALLCVQSTPSTAVLLWLHWRDIYRKPLTITPSSLNGCNRIMLEVLKALSWEGKSLEEKGWDTRAPFPGNLKSKKLRGRERGGNEDKQTHTIWAWGWGLRRKWVVVVVDVDKSGGDGEEWICKWSSW